MTSSPPGNGKNGAPAGGGANGRPETSSAGDLASSGVEPLSGDPGEDGLEIVELSQADIAIVSDDTEELDEEFRARFTALRDSYLAEVKRLPPTQRDRQAMLLHEVGRLEEEVLVDTDAAIKHYKEAHARDTSLLVNLRALRRLQIECGDLAGALATLDAEVRVCRQQIQRASLLYERGLLQLGSGDERGAEASFNRALEMDASFLPALAVLAHLAESRGDAAVASKLLVRMAQVCNDDRRKALILAEVAVHADVEGKTGEALDRYRVVLGYDPELVGARFALERLYTARGDWGALTDLLLQKADRTSDVGSNAANRFLAGALSLHRLGEDLRAALLFEQCLASRPDRALPLPDLQEIYSRHGRSPELLSTLQKRLELGEGRLSAAQLAALVYRMAEVRESLGEQGDAATLYRDALARQPGFLPARRALARVLRAGEHWVEVAELLRSEVDQETSDPRRYDLLVELAELTELQLEEPTFAEELYEEALGIQPGRGAASRALERLYTVRERWEKLVELLDQMAEHSADAGLRTSLLKRKAWVQEAHLKRPDLAAETLERLLDAAPSRRDIPLALGRVYQSQARITDLVTTLEQEAALSEDGEEVLALLGQAGELAELHLGDPGRARLLYQKVLERNPDHHPALRRLGRLHLAAGHWDELVEVLKREMEVEPNPAAKAILAYQMGQLQEARLGDTAAAERSYQVALGLTPDYAPPQDALAGLLYRRSRWSELVKLIVDRAEATVTPDRRADGFLRGAILTYHRMGKVVPALALCQKAKEADRRHLEARLLWEHLSVADNRFSELADTLAESLADDSLPRADRVRLGLKLSQIRRVHLKSVDGALEAARAVLALDPRHAESLYLTATLTRRSGDTQKLAELLGHLADTTADPVTATADLLQLSAVLPQDEEHDAIRVDLFDRVLTINPAHPFAVSMLERLARRAGHLGMLQDILRKRAEEDDDPASQILALMTLGDLAFRSGDLEEAAQCYTSAKEKSGGWLPTLRALRVLREAQGLGTEQAELLEAEAAASADQEAATRALMLAANIWLQSYMDTERAERLYAQVFEQDPRNGVAFQRLTALLLGRQAHSELVLIYRRRIGVAEGAVRLALLLDLAKLWHDSLDRPDEAAQVLEELLRADPSHEEALHRIAGIYGDLGRHRQAATALERLGAVSRDPDVVRRAHLRRSELLETALGEDDKALEAVLSVLGKAPGDPDALRISARLHGRLGRWDGAVAALGRMAETAELAERARLLLEMAGIEQRSLGRDDLAEEHVTHAATLCVTAPEACQDLVAFFVERRQVDRLDLVLEHVLRAAPARSPGIVSLRLARAQNLSERLGRPDDAEREVRQALTEAPGSVAALLALGELHLRRDNAALAQVEYQAVLERDPFHAQAYRGLRRVFWAKGERDRARLAAQVLTTLEAATEEDVALARELVDPVSIAASDARLGLEGYLELISPRDDMPEARQLLDVLAPHLHTLFPSDEQARGVTPESELGPGNPLRLRADRLAAMLGVAEPFRVALSESRPDDVSLAYGETPLIIVGRHAAEQGHRILDFQLGRALGRVLTGTVHLATVGLRRLEVTLAGVAAQFDKSFGLHLGGDEDLQELGRNFLKQLSRKAKKAVEEPARAYAAANPVGMHAWAETVGQGVARCGLLASADLSGAIRVLRREGASDDEIAGLCIFNISPRYAEARQRLGLAEE